MARYNTITPVASTTGAATIPTPSAGLLTTFTGSAPYTVTLPTPVLYTGITQSFFNNTGGVVTIASPSGNIIGPGFAAATSQAVPNQSTYTVVSDGTNYVIINNEGGPQLASTGTFSGTLTANGSIVANSGVSLNPANANVVISPTGTGVVTINPATAGSINNVNIGATSAGNITANTITVNTSLTGNGTIDGGTF
jgi:cytoskeletal protein CcmA (bactofilin family)